MEKSWIFYISLAVQCTLLWAAKLERYVIPEVDECNSHFRQISAAIVTSSRAIPLQFQDSPCYLKFSADGNIVTRKRLMLKFTELRIDDERVKFKIYDGRSQLTMVLHEFTKGATPPVNISESTSNFFTVELDLNNAPAYSFAFTMYVTAFESRRGSSVCVDYKCNNGYCINKDLVCDNADSCFDGSDEFQGPPSQCKPAPPDNSGVNDLTGTTIKTGSTGIGTIGNNIEVANPYGGDQPKYKISKPKQDSVMQRGGIETIQKWVIGLIVVISVVLVAIIVICVFCCLKRSKPGDTGQQPPSPSGGPSTTMTTAYHVAPTSDTNGTQANNHNTEPESVQFL